MHENPIQNSVLTAACQERTLPARLCHSKLEFDTRKTAHTTCLLLQHRCMSPMWVHWLDALLKS